MKKAVSLSAFPAAPGMPALFSADLLSNVARIAELGYDGVDLYINDPKADESVLAASLLRQYKLGVGVVLPAAMARQNLFLGNPDPHVRRTALEKMSDILAYAGDCGAMVSLGLVRGSAEAGDTLEAFLERFADSCAKLLPVADRYGVKLLIEPINRYEINTLNSSLEALRFIKAGGLDLYLMLDTFHMNIEDRSFEESFTACGGLTAHIHFLDSNRLAPGMGHLDMPRLYNMIKATGYDGYLCLEALPLPDAMTCAANGISFFAQYERQANQPCRLE